MSRGEREAKTQRGVIVVLTEGQNQKTLILVGVKNSKETPEKSHQREKRLMLSDSVLSETGVKIVVVSFFDRSRLVSVQGVVGRLGRVVSARTSES